MEIYLERQFLTRSSIFCMKFQADTIIEMLVSASEQTAYHLKPTTGGRSCANDAQTLLRVLCHKKDGSASEFLKMHYQLPKSSGAHIYTYIFIQLVMKVVSWFVLLFGIKYLQLPNCLTLCYSIHNLPTSQMKICLDFCFIVFFFVLISLLNIYHTLNLKLVIY